MKRITASLIAMALSMGASTSAYAQDATRFVIDTIVVTVREQPDDTSPVVERLSSGDRVSVTGQTDDTYLQIFLADGALGWIDGRYLSTEQVAGVRLEALTAEFKALQALHVQSRTAQTESEQSLIRLSDDYARLDEELTQLRASTGHPSDWEQQREQLEERLSLAEAQTERLRRRTEEMKENSDWTWFLTGAGVLLAGMILGFAIPRGRRARSSWGEL